jgi:hypothetical protein
MTAFNARPQTPVDILEGLAEMFGRTAEGVPLMRPDDQIKAMTGLVENIGNVAAENPEAKASVVHTLRQCSGNPVLKQDRMAPVVSAITAKLEPLI